MDKKDYKPKPRIETMGMSIEQYKAIHGCKPTRKQKQKPQQVEASIMRQIRLECELIKYKNGRLSEYLTHVPNEGKRSAIQGQELKRQGLQPGYPDLILDVARGGYFGMRIEVKSKGKKVKDGSLQEQWLEKLNEEGYHAVWTRGVAETMDAIKEYMALPATEVK